MDRGQDHDPTGGGSYREREIQSRPVCCGSDCGGQQSVAAKPPEADAALAEGARSFQVSGLDCAEEVAILKRALGPAVGGEEHLAFDVVNGRMTVLGSAEPVREDVVIRRVRETGMTASPWTEQGTGAGQARHRRRQKLYTAVSGVFWLAGLVYHALTTDAAGLLRIFAGHDGVPVPPVEIGLFVAAILFGARFVAPKAWYAAKQLRPDMNLLMVVAVAGAVMLGEFFEAATVAFLFALSLTLEAWSVGRARNAVAALLDLAPPRARIVRADGTEVEVPAAEVAVGTRFVVRGGDRIPLDGRVVEGLSEINQAPITGESAPVAKEPGDEVYAGTINGDGTLTLEATKAATDTVLARIIRMVSEAHSRRAPVEQWVERFARVYTPAVMAIAVAIFLIPPLAFGADWSAWFYNALVLLVIACPCALVISTPVSIVAALASSARNGVLIKGGAYVELPARLETVAMDKTGTITKGTPALVGVHPVNGLDDAGVIAAAAALEVRSSHPLAQAILTAAEQRGIAPVPAEAVEIVPGRGVTGRIKGRGIWLGSHRFAGEQGVLDQVPAKVATALEEQGQTAIFVGDEQTLLGIIAVADAIRDDAETAIDSLHRLGVKRLVMLTGDNERTALAVARAVGIDEVRAELLPEDKVAAVEALASEHQVVAMIGDGVNDAPAMARAHFGISMGAIGSDAAIETADIALMTDDITKLPWLVHHSRRTMAVIRQNIAFSLAVKALFVILAGFGLATLWGAIAADVGASLLVVANALRLLRPADMKLARHGESVGEKMAEGLLAHGH